MKLNIIVKKSEKTGKLYRSLVVDLGYRQATLTFDDNLIAEIMGVSVGALYSLPIGAREIGDVLLKK